MKFSTAIVTLIAQLGVVFGKPEAQLPNGMGQPYFTSKRIWPPPEFNLPSLKFIQPASVGPLLSALPGPQVSQAGNGLVYNFPRLKIPKAPLKPPASSVEPILSSSRHIPKAGDAKKKKIHKYEQGNKGQGNKAEQGNSKQGSYVYNSDGFKCDNGELLDEESWGCDNVYDCEDKSDEKFQCEAHDQDDCPERLLVTLKGAAKDAQSDYAGLFIKQAGKKSNDLPYWVKGDKALWFYGPGPYWVFGKMSDLGEVEDDHSVIFSESVSDAACPIDLVWAYLDENDNWTHNSNGLEEIALHSDDQIYNKLKLTRCSETFYSFPTLDLAKKACTYNEFCGAVYDRGCNDRNSFELCYNEENTDYQPAYPDSESSCIYRKQDDNDFNCWYGVEGDPEECGVNASCVQYGTWEQEPEKIGNRKKGCRCPGPGDPHVRCFQVFQVSLSSSPAAEILNPVDILKPEVSHLLVLQKGDEVNFECNVQGSSLKDYTIVWKYFRHYGSWGDTVIHNKANVLVEGKYLTLKSFSKDMEGYYTCMPASKEGFTHSNSIRLALKDKCKEEACPMPGGTVPSGHPLMG